MKLVTIVGARPQFIKLFPIQQAIAQLSANSSRFSSVLVHTGQHYDYRLSQIFFDELGIRPPDYHLEVGSGPHGQQTALVLQRVEEVLLKEQPDVVVVYGDTNSTLGGAMAASKLHIPLAHVEAGLRSFNKKMPDRQFLIGRHRGARKGRIMRMPFRISIIPGSFR
jgi:UDP-N-acetylglucosamine 2-epimerase